ncbi:coiled-coil domain-containing protein 62-like isoform X2 [Tubulanus polymorphus]|uniref:coiled-coil domain-containing protein 62-like isoform X2 n=1 Tax=Tubulanus polymorphus TaxID=672921 RepID=UPI003DA63FEC
MTEENGLVTPTKALGSTNYSSPIFNGLGSSNRSGESRCRNISTSSPSPSRLTDTAAFSPYYSQGMSPSALSDDIIKKQRKELQLLITELKDRDHELNDMLAAHKKQLLGWEEDRQRVLTLEQKLSRAQVDFQNKREECKRVRNKLKVLMNEGQSNASALENTQEQLVKLSEQSSQKDLYLQDLEEKNGNLNSIVNDLNSKLGQLEAREHELLTMVKLKDKDLLSASDHISDLSSKLKKFDFQNRESLRNEANARKAANEWKSKYIDLKKDFDALKGELSKKQNEYDTLSVDVEKMKLELADLNTQCEHSNEREKRKEELIELGKSKQERTESELSNLRMIYERQQKDITLLHLNLESSKELLARQRDTFTATINDSLLEDTGRPLSEYTIRTSSPDPNPISGSRSAITFNDRNSFISSINQDDTHEISFQTLEPEHNDFILPSATEERFSPTSKLHRLLMESRQMVDNLEKAALTPSINKQNTSREPLSPSGKHTPVSNSEDEVNK